jgi:hypothetical protein
MRHWLFHPLIFYPLAIILAVVVIALSVKPQSWPRAPEPAPAAHAEGWLIWEGKGFNAPDAGFEQDMTVVRDFLGRPLAWRIAQRSGLLPEVTQDDDGARILLTPEDAAALAGRPVTIEITYNPLPVNAATELAVSLRGDWPSEWVTQAAPPQSATLRFDLPAQDSVNAIGLRVLSHMNDQAYGLEITRIRISPHA